MSAGARALASSSPIEVLRALPLFEGAAETTMQALATEAKERVFDRGKIIFRHGEPGQTMLVVLAGEIQISRVGGNGQEHFLRILGKGELFGEIAMLDGGPRTTEVMAYTKVKLLEFRRDQILAAVRSDPALAIGMMVVLCQRLRAVDSSLELMLSHDVNARLALTLLTVARGTSNGRINMTQQALGDMVRASRETINRKLREWETAGFVALEPGAVRLLDLPALWAIVPGGESPVWGGGRLAGTGWIG